MLRVAGMSGRRGRKGQQEERRIINTRNYFISAMFIEIGFTKVTKDEGFF